LEEKNEVAQRIFFTFSPEEEVSKHGLLLSIYVQVNILATYRNIGQIFFKSSGHTGSGYVLRLLI
jgi:hypothetical protein